MATDDAIEFLTEELRALAVRTHQVEQELRTIRQRRQELRTLRERDVDTPAGPYEAGDRVRITNKVIRPSNWLKRWDSNTIEAERRATVTHTVRNQVWIRTDNGTKTWRAPNNLERLD